MAPQEKRSSYSHSHNGQNTGAQSQLDSGGYGPSTFYEAGAQALMKVHEVDELIRVPHSATSSTTWPQDQDFTNLAPSNAGAHQPYYHQHGQSLQHLPDTAYQVAHDQDMHPVAYQGPTTHQSQTFHPPRSQLQSQSQILQAPQQAPAAGGSWVPRPSAEDHFAWQQLCSNRAQWNPNAREPVRRDGESVLMSFASRGDKKIHCRVPTPNGFCEYSNVKKERLLHHIRKDHLSFLPFVCGGRCTSQACKMRFACETAMNEHINPRKDRCEICGKEMYSQNLSLHFERCSQRQGP